MSQTLGNFRYLDFRTCRRSEILKTPRFSWFWGFGIGMVCAPFAGGNTPPPRGWRPPFRPIFNPLDCAQGPRSGCRRGPARRAPGAGKFRTYRGQFPVQNGTRFGSIRRSASEPRAAGAATARRDDRRSSTSPNQHYADHGRHRTSRCRKHGTVPDALLQHGRSLLLSLTIHTQQCTGTKFQIINTNY